MVRLILLSSGTTPLIIWNLQTLDRRAFYNLDPISSVASPFSSFMSCQLFAGAVEAVSHRPYLILLCKKSTSSYVMTSGLAVWLELERANPDFFFNSTLTLKASLVRQPDEQQFWIHCWVRNCVSLLCGSLSWHMLSSNNAMPYITGWASSEVWSLCFRCNAIFETSFLAWHVDYI